MAKIANEKCVPLAEEEVQDHVLSGKLRQSKRMLGNLIIIDLLVSPVLFTIILSSLWMELDYPKLSIAGICSLIRHLNGTYVVASLILWTVAHGCNLFLLMAITNDNMKYCKTYGSTLGPVLGGMVIFFFSLLMWSSLSPLPNYTVAKFLIVVSSVVALLANFYNYLMDAMADHFQLLARFKMMKYKMAQAV